MRVILFGASGMVGRGVLLEALDDPDVVEVLSIARSPLDIRHAKLREVLHEDFTDFSALEPQLKGYDGCFFCLGVSSAGMKEEAYKRVTYDFTIAAAEAVARGSPQAVFTYVSGMGTDSTEAGRTMWARVKGRTENTLLEMPFRGAYMFRPGVIVPERGIRSRTALYRAFYAAMKPFMGLMRNSRSVTTTSRMGLAMLECAQRPPTKRILEAPDINELAARRAASRAAPLSGS